MQQVVATDGQSVAVTRHHEDLEVGAGQLEAGRDGGRATVDGVESVRVHVVREAARAADPGDEHDVLLGNVEIGHALLHGGEDRVVSAPRAPTDVLIRLEIFLGIATGLGGPRATRAHTLLPMSWTIAS